MCSLSYQYVHNILRDEKILMSSMSQTIEK